MSRSNDERPWRFASASAIGRSHVASGIPCQDASACEIFSRAGAPVLLSIVCDGAGSAPFAHFGARFACQIVLDEARTALGADRGVATLDRGFALDVIGRFRHALARIARRMGASTRDFACTLLFAAVDEHAAVFAQIGDGAIVVSPRPPEGEPASRDYSWVFWPQQGEYVNQTHFASEARAEEHLCFELREQPIDELALFSDGLQNLVLDARRKVAHGRFFEPMFVAVRWAGPGRSQALSRSLDRYLRTPGIESRTDDDKSLVLASRRTPAPRPALPVAVGGVLSTALMPRELHD